MYLEPSPKKLYVNIMLKVLLKLPDVSVLTNMDQICIVLFVSF